MLPTGTDFAINIKFALDTEYDLAKDVSLMAIAAKDSELATYVYKISKLDSGSKYNVRVAVIDKTITDSEGSYPMSNFSDPLSIRTEFSQDDYDKAEKYEEYQNYYDEKLNKIVNDLAFVLEDSKNSYTIKYKEDKMQGELGSISETTFTLPVTDTATSYTYYISKANINELMRLKKGLQIIKDDISIIIPYKFINDEYSKEYKNLLEACEDIKDDVEDFYFKIWVGFSNPNSYVAGNKTSSKQVQIGMKLIEQSGLNIDIDFMIESEMLDIIAENKTDFMNNLDKELEGEIDDKLFLELVDEKEKELREELEEIANDRLSEYELDSHSLNSVNADINIKFNTQDASSKIYVKGNTDTKWNYTNTIISLGNASGYMNKLGSAVLTTSANTELMYGNEDEANAYFAKQKYNLDNILIRNGSLNSKNDKVSKALFLDIAFAVMAIDTEDIFELANQKKALESKFVFYNDPLTRQEAVYGIMQLYNMFSQIDINQVIINSASSAINYDIAGYYKQSILAGVQLGLIGTYDISNPNEYLTVDEMLDILYRVMNE